MSKNLLDEALEQGSDLLSSLTEEVKKLPKDFAKSTVAQVTGETVKPDAPKRSAEDKQFIEDLYGANNETNQQQAQQQSLQSQAQPTRNTPQEQQQIENLKKQLHAQYFENLNKKPQQEERVAEKIEQQEKQQEQVKLYEKKKKQQSIAVTQAANKAETYRGSSG